MVDGLASELGDKGTASLATDAVSGAVIADNGIAPGKLDTDCVVTGAISGLAVTTAKIAAGAIEASKQGFVGTGSPAAFGISMQAGSNATGAGSSVWVAFGTPFAAQPFVLVSSAETNEALLAPAGSWQAGSFYVETTTASQTFAWLAIGSGDL